MAARPTGSRSIPGDGIGKETVPEGLRVLDAAARRFGFALETDDYDWSCETLQAHRRDDAGRRAGPAREHDACSSARSAGRTCRTMSRSGAC